MARRRFDLYDGDEIVLENATHGEVDDFLGAKINLTQYIRNKMTYRGKYTIHYADNLSEPDPFIKAWEEARAPFKNIVWVREGGRRLIIGGKK